MSQGESFLLHTVLPVSRNNGDSVAVNSNADETASFNSYKFPRPRFYTPNDFPETGESVLDRLNYLAQNVGPKDRSKQYNDEVIRLLQLSKPKVVKKKQTKVIVNSVDTNSTIKLVDLTFSSFVVSALVDTGSTHCLISTESFDKLSTVPFVPVKLHMKVAGHVLKNNVVGKATMPVTFKTALNGKITIYLEFLIANVLNGYDAIIGADFLMDEEMLTAITPKSLIFAAKYSSAVIPLSSVKTDHQLNFIEIKEDVSIPSGCEKLVQVSVVFDESDPQNFLHSSILNNALFLKSNNDVRYSCSNVQSSNEDYPDFHCILRNNSLDELDFERDSIVASLSSKKCAKPKSKIPDSLLITDDDKYRPDSSNTDFSPDSSNIAESMDEKILEENMIVDTSNLDKVYTWEDCEIDPDLDPEIKRQLHEILKENSSTFARTKLDVGKFPHFTVQLEITDDIPRDQFRPMSEEKLAYCDKTFTTFEEMGLVEECHTPKTISNLHLVPKYEGLRDLTKASTYLAQVKGFKNTQFRIVQDLRRVNAATKNIKRTIPKLPEQIFQKMQGKIVSSMDANQAYWHLILAPESRPYTCFYLRNRVLQFNRMVQGLTSAPACWDQAMEIIFSKKTMYDIKLKLTLAEAKKLPEDFSSFFANWQDDSWIFSDTPEMHLLHLKVVLMAYKENDIKISANKSTFFPKSFKILGVNFSPRDSTLALDRVKAQSILDWEKPDSLYTLQSRLYALIYWQKFLPNLAELKFPLNQILRSGIFSWTREADDAWNNIKSLIALDIRLTIPERHEQLLITTDASKIACSGILWVLRGKELKVVGCYSKLFSHTDSLKNIHFKETFALVQCFNHFRPYLLNTTKTVVVFTDARALMWVSRNREYSIACSGLVNKLAKLQLEIPHKIYSVPSEVNYLADIFSRAFHSSRFLDKSVYSLSKVQANKIPPLRDPFVLDEDALYQYFAQPLHGEESDNYPRRKSKISTPKPIKSLYKLFQDCTPEQKYLSALRLLQGWDDKSIHENSASKSELQSNALRVIEAKDKPLFKEFCKRAIAKAVKETMQKVYTDCDPEVSKRIEATLSENFSKIVRENLISTMEQEFLQQELIANVTSVETDLCLPIRYNLAPNSEFKPAIDKVDFSVQLPLQTTLSLQPGELSLVDLGVQLIMPDGSYGVTKQVVPDTLALYPHTGVSSSDGTVSFKIFARNVSNSTVTFPADTIFVKIVPCTFNLHSGESNCLADALKSPVVTIQDEPSLLHNFLQKRSPTELNFTDLYCTVHVPLDDVSQYSVLQSIRLFDELQWFHLQENSCVPLRGLEQNKETVIEDFTSALVKEKASLLNMQIVAPEKLSEYTKAQVDSLKKTLHFDMCQKLAVLGIDLLRNQAITRDIFARAQQSDDYLSVIYQSIQEGTLDFKNFIIKNSVLYKKIHDKHFGSAKFVICLPEILAPAVIHTLHTMLGHPSLTATIKNFQTYYYYPRASNMCKDYVRSCITCVFAGKYDLKKVKTSTDRTLKPTRPRQHLYCDLIPMPKGQFSYILFCLDAYSQFVYALPLKDKTAFSVLQGFLSLFATVGWYDSLYLDNESSFLKTAKILVKIAPISVHYSTPYCHFQNNAENYIKSFKRNFLKILNDSEEPQENQDWALLLPTVVQSLNRQIIQSVGVSRDSIHFNTPASFFPLAEISAEDNEVFNKAFDNVDPDVYQSVKQSRDRYVSRSHKAKVPEFYENQIVFVIDQTPSTQGVSSVLKIPMKGPFRISKIEDRNVTLEDLESSKIYHSHVELLRPLDLKEFRLLLNKKWDLNAHLVKAAQTVATRSTFDTPLTALSKAEVLGVENTVPEIEDELELEHLLYPAPEQTPLKQPELRNFPLESVDVLAERLDFQPIPPPLGEVPLVPEIQEIQDEFSVDTLKFSGDDFMTIPLQVSEVPKIPEVLNFNGVDFVIIPLKISEVPLVSEVLKFNGVDFVKIPLQVSEVPLLPEVPEIQENFPTDTLTFNSYKVGEDLSKSYVRRPPQKNIVLKK